MNLLSTFEAKFATTLLLILLVMIVGMLTTTITAFGFGVGGLMIPTALALYMAVDEAKHTRH